MTWLKWLGLALGLLVVVAISAAAYGSSRWSEATQTLLARLEAARLPPAIARYDAREIEGLPVPVQRYFRAVLKDGQPVVAAVSLEHIGTMNMSETGELWKPFHFEAAGRHATPRLRLGCPHHDAARLAGACA